MRVQRSRQRLFLRFALPKWNSNWSCYSWEVEVVLPGCVRLHDFADNFGDVAHVRGLGPVNNSALWTVEVDHAQKHEGEVNSYRTDECYTPETFGDRRDSAPSDIQRGWFIVRVKAAANDAYITLPGGGTHRLYPFSVGTRP